MGANEYAGGAGVLLVIWFLFANTKEQGLKSTFGIVGEVFAFLAKMYALIIAPPVLAVWALSKFVVVKDHQLLMILAILGAIAATIKLSDFLDRDKK